MSRYSLSQRLQANGSHLLLWVKHQSYLTPVKEPENSSIKYPRFRDPNREQSEVGSLTRPHFLTCGFL
jgi:hypothetical protein